MLKQKTRNYIESLYTCSRRGCTRTDYGGENPLVATAQFTFVGDDAHIYEPSTGNQRIERWWGSMFCGGLNFWVKYFRKLERDGTYDYEDPYQFVCVQYVFGSFIQSDLHDIKEWWNFNNVRKSAHTSGGVPYNLYHNPEADKNDCGIPAVPDLRNVLEFDNSLLDMEDPF